jgi:CRP-like cAMP-binding protein
MLQALDYDLANQPFLRGMNPQQLATIEECAASASFRAGDFLFRQGDPAHYFYIVTRGKVSLEVFVPGRGPLTIQTVGEDEVIGWSWLFPPYQWHFDARALNLTRAIAFNAMCLRGKCEADHDLGYELVKRFAHTIMERLQATRLQLIEAYDEYHK